MKEFYECAYYLKKNPEVSYDLMRTKYTNVTVTCETYHLDEPANKKEAFYMILFKSKELAKREKEQEPIQFRVTGKFGGREFDILSMFHTAGLTPVYLEEIEGMEYSNDITHISFHWFSFNPAWIGHDQ